MAPRSAKTKKAADVKVAETEPKKGRGKAKVIEEEEPEAIDAEVNEVVVTEKKTKRGKKATSEEQSNGDINEKAPPAKKGRKKNVEVPTQVDKPVNDDEAEEESHILIGETEKNEEKVESNGDADDKQSASSGRGRKKQTKKETEKTSSIESKIGRGRKTTKRNEEEITETDLEKDDIIEEKVAEGKPKSGKGRGRKAQPIVETEPEDKYKEPKEEEVKELPATKGRKKAPAKKEKTPEVGNDDLNEEQKESEDKPTEEPKKKEPKGKKNLGKKAQAKDEEMDVDVKEEALSKKRKGNKKDDKVELIEESEEEVPESKPVKGKRGQKKVVETLTETEEEPQDTGEPTSKRRRKVAEEKAPEDSKKKAPKNKATTEFEDLDFSNDSKSVQSKNWNFKISSWNVNGIRAWLSKGGLDYIRHEKPDILCMQEVKCALDKLPDELANLPGYHAYWLCSDKDGYAGVGIYTTKLAMNVTYGLQNEELDSEGRIITAEYEQFYLITTYVPNAGRKLVTLPKRLQWNAEFRKYVKELDKKKPVIICGDMNVSHKEIDLANPKTNRKNAGFTDEERAGMTELLGDGFIDTYRHLNPDKTGAYTFWTHMMNCRAKNVGWRLDYFIISERLLPSLCDSVIRDKVYGSDHCPISVFLHLSSADKPKE